MKRAIRMIIASVSAVAVMLALMPVGSVGQVISNNIDTTPASYSPVGASVYDDKTEKSLKERIEGLEKEFKRLGKLEKDLETELKKFEKDTEDHFKDTDQSIGAIEDELPGLIHSGNSGSTMKVSGRVHADYWTFPQAGAGIQALEGENPQDRINFRRLRFGVAGKLKDHMRYKIEMEFAGGNDVEFRDAYLGFEHTPLFNTIIVGNHKRPYGLDHLNSSRYNVFLERPFVIESVNQDARRLGISSNGVSDDQSWNWRYGVYNMRLVQALGGYVGDHYQLEGAGRLARTWWYDESSDGRGYGHWAVSGALRFPNGSGLGTTNESRFRHRPEARSRSRWLNTGRIAGADKEYILGLENVFNVGAVQFVTEYMGVTVDRATASGQDLFFHGGYAYVSYFLTGEHIPWSRKSGTLGRVKPFENFFGVRGEDGSVRRGIGAWQVAARYSYADFSDDNILGGEGESLTLGLNWHWNPYARMQFNYILGDISNTGAPEFPVGSGGTYQIFGCRMMVDF